jgi:Tfp pilus assembly protein FimT
VFVTTVMVVLMAIAIPHARTSIERSRGLGAARHLASRMALARAQAVSRSATIALWFDAGERGVAVGVVQDGNRNGVRTREIQLGIDRVLEAPALLSDLFPGVVIETTPQPSILSFTPVGTSSSTTVTLRGRDGTQWAVRVLGTTGRTRVLRYVPATREWVYAS